MVSRCILADTYTSLYWYEQLMPNRLCPHVVFSLSKGNGIEDLCRWPAEQLNTMRNIEEQISKGLWGTGGGFASSRSVQVPSWCRTGCHCAPHPPPCNANRIRRRRAPSPQNPRLFLTCPVWSGVLRVPLSCFQKPEARPRGRLWDSIWSTS